LHFYISTFWSMSAGPSMTIFCSSLMTCFPVGCWVIFWVMDMSFPVACIVRGITIYVPHTLHSYFKFLIIMFKMLRVLSYLNVFVLKLQWQVTDMSVFIMKEVIRTCVRCIS
jgi:hypothetical protein